MSTSVHLLILVHSNMATEEPQKDMQWGSIRATRTKAMPKTTLFGSALEMRTKQQQKEMADIDLTEVNQTVIKASQPKHARLSDADESRIPGRWR